MPMWLIVGKHAQCPDTFPHSTLGKDAQGQAGMPTQWESMPKCQARKDHQSGGGAHHILGMHACVFIHWLG